MEGRSGYGHFANERRLTQLEIDTIARWAKAGAPEGNPAKAPQPPQFTEGWQLGKPDLIVGMKQPYSVPAHGEDEYQCFVLPVNLPQTSLCGRSNSGLRIGRVMHHALIFADNTHSASKAAAEAGGSFSSSGLQAFCHPRPSAAGRLEPA